MKSLVTGGAGFIGSNMVERLIELGHEVICIDNMSANSNDNFYWHSDAINYTFDICDKSSIRDLFEGVDYVFHMAAESRIMNTIDNPIKAVSTNSLGTSIVLQCAREANCKRFVYSSTSSVYGKNKSPNQENQIPDCLNPYSSSKYAGEIFCKNYYDLFGLETIILRYFNVYGNRNPSKGQYAPVIAIFERQKKENQPLTIVGDGTQRRDFVNVIDVVEANIKAATTSIPKELFGTPFNVGTFKNYSIIDIANLISKNIKFIEERPGEMKETLANNSKIKEFLNWSNTIYLEEYIKDNI